MMRKTRLLLLAPVIAAAAVFIYLKVLGGSGPPPLDPSSSVSDGAGLSPGRTGPLFRFGNPYLDGRSAWLRERFDAEIGRLASAPPPAEVHIEAKVRREPFTQGPWLAGLTPEVAAYRQEVESNAMESSFGFTVPGISARDLLLFLVFSDFRNRIDGIGKLERRLHIPPLDPVPPDLGPLPPLAPSEMLIHEERQVPVALAMPTSLYHLQRVERIGGALVMRHELWKNTGGTSCAPVHFDSSQCVFRDVDGGSSFAFTSIYSGQKVPPFFESMAARMTSESYGKFVEAVRREAPRWKPSPEALRWAERALDV